MNGFNVLCWTLAMGCHVDKVIEADESARQPPRREEIKFVLMGADAVP